jgi:hypothetical protein
MLLERIQERWKTQYTKSLMEHSRVNRKVLLDKVESLEKMKEQGQKRKLKQEEIVRQHKSEGAVGRPFLRTIMPTEDHFRSMEKIERMKPSSFGHYSKTECKYLSYINECSFTHDFGGRTCLLIGNKYNKQLISFFTH